MNDDTNSDKRREALRRLVQRQGTHAERERAHAAGDYWVDALRAVSIVAEGLDEQRDYGYRLFGLDPISAEDIDAALMAVVDARHLAEQRELKVLHAARASGRTWEQIAALMDANFSAVARVTPAQAKARYTALAKKYPATIRQLGKPSPAPPAATPSEPS
uniref:hypothetical protein n=1 Tax=Nonomuraea sp. CA-252377 TaxID=3240003 RepID=UPI003F49454D